MTFDVQASSSESWSGEVNERETRLPTGEEASYEGTSSNFKI